MSLPAPKTPPQGRSAARWPWKLLPAGVALFLLAIFAYGWAGPSQTYESLRLIGEALHEINQKYVWPRDEGEMIQGALRGMMHSLDPDSSFLTPQEFKELEQGGAPGKAEAGMELVVKDNLLTVVSVLDGGPARRAGLMPGDHILKINGQIIRNITTQEGVRRFQGNPGTSLKLQVLRNNLAKPLDISVNLEPLSPAAVSTYSLADSYAYIRIPYFSNDTPAELASALKKLKRNRPLAGVVLDLRNNARGTMEQGVRTASVLLGDRIIVSTRGRQHETPQFYYGKAYDLVLKPLPYLVVLVDQGTARAAEILAGALQDYDEAVLLGTRSFGLCGITRALPLKDGSALVMTVAQCYTPKGNKITGKALEPQIAGTKPEGKAPPQEADKPLPPDQDPWVRQALEILKKGKTPQIAKHKNLE